MIFLLIIILLTTVILLIFINIYWKNTIWNNVSVYWIFIGLLTSIVNTSSHTKCKSLSNQQCMTQPTLVNLHLNEYSQWLRHYPFAINLDRCVGSCSTFKDLSNRVCVLNKT